ncbi:LPS assembly protein LptD [Psychromonas algicola]|uniref:LPS assembly protein LptD n=1 Tax=Psychromonas algicola TaxID=2555642 RepID=UPI001067DBB2|nr:LPS assembly protein LptD [Psychromonas sp. RZ5]TEW51862.1 LPS assembly protein LptD [Psychromonas sp. RZ5]
MLKYIPLLFMLSPIAHAAEQSETNDSVTQDDVDTQMSLKENSALRKVDAFFQQCYQNVPPRIKSNNKLDRNQIPVDISADTLTGFAGDIFYQGNVNLVQGDKTLTSDTLSYSRSAEQAYAAGNVRFVDGEITLTADQIKTNLKTDESSLFKTEYQFHGQGGRGDADLIYDNGQNLYEFNSSSYTACPPQDTTWSIESSTMYIDNASEVGSAYNAVLKIKGIPVFYFPYINYPLTDKRKTGLLFPTYENSSINGITVAQPLYINLTTNQDMTFTPTYMADRGLLLKNEYRYLFDIGSGKIATEYLGTDKLNEDDDEEENTRYLLHLNHNITFAKNWNFNAEYTRVSDEDYFNDIETDYGTQSDGQLLQTAELSYTSMNWNSSVEVRDFQVLDEDEDSYIVLPKVSLNAYQPLDWRSLQFEWYSEVTKFSHNDDDVYTGTRVHAEPKIVLPLYYDSLFINTELKYMLSLYQQDLGTTDTYDEYDETATRYIPSFKIHSGINLERDFTLFDKNYRQTLVPQMQYLYVPYEDQSNIGLYDTTTLESDYYGLFRDNRYSGYDRIADANQITFGLSSSFINNQGKEKLRFAVGQNYYFEESKVTLDEDDSSDEDEVSRSSMIGEFDINFENDYFLHAGVEWDSNDKVIERANTTVEKRWANNTYLQASYRYYKESDDADWDEIINQVGGKLNWSISSQWSTFASYYYDLNVDNTFESIVGLKYQSCCWSISLTYDQHMLSYYDEEDDLESTLETETSYGITFELTGLGGTDVADGDEGLFDYGRPFYLK